jgi:hypothetical protein
MALWRAQAAQAALPKKRIGKKNSGCTARGGPAATSALIVDENDSPPPTSGFKAMGSFSFTTEIKEDRTLLLPAGTPIGRVTVAITPAEEAAPTGRRLLAKLLDLQAAIPVAAGLSQGQIDTALERERASWR